MLFSGNRIQYRFTAAFGEAWYNNACPTGTNIDFEVDSGERWVVDLLQRGGKHLEDGRTGLSVLTADDTQQRFTLSLIRTIVHNEKSFTLSFVDRARPAKDADESEAIQPDLAVKSFVDLEGAYGLTVSRCWRGIELARAPIGAIAIYELSSF
ncbi:hypothetical protein XH87_30605 [Bradyrhizobium sp. CCBAU 53415]|nr:hypothetical protein [Bradyrhizobium sp. CCBAU 53415]